MLSRFKIHTPLIKILHIKIQYYKVEIPSAINMRNNNNNNNKFMSKLIT